MEELSRFKIALVWKSGAFGSYAAGSSLLVRGLVAVTFNIPAPMSVK